MKEKHRKAIKDYKQPILPQLEIIDKGSDDSAVVAEYMEVSRKKRLEKMLSK